MNTEASGGQRNVRWIQKRPVDRGASGGQRSVRWTEKRPVDRGVSGGQKSVQWTEKCRQPYDIHSSDGRSSNTVRQLFIVAAGAHQTGSIISSRQTGDEGTTSNWGGCRTSDKRLPDIRRTLAGYQASVCRSRMAVNTVWYAYITRFGAMEG